MHTSTRARRLKPRPPFRPAGVRRLPPRPARGQLRATAAPPVVPESARPHSQPQPQPQPQPEQEPEPGPEPELELDSHKEGGKGRGAAVELRGVSEMLQPTLVVDAGEDAGEEGAHLVGAPPASGVEVDTLTSLLALWRWALAARCGLHAVLGHAPSELDE